MSLSYLAHFPDTLSLVPGAFWIFSSRAFLEADERQHTPKGDAAVLTKLQHKLQIPDSI